MHSGVKYVLLANIEVADRKEYKHFLSDQSEV